MNPVKIIPRSQCAPETSHAFKMKQAIDENTTAEEFEKKRNELKALYNYKLIDSDGGPTILSKAAQFCNISLMRHIIKEGRKENQNLIDIGDNDGLTPLFYAAINVDKAKAFQAAKELLKQGASVNLATRHIFEDDEGSSSPKFSTPLWAACEKSKNIKLIKLLLQRGGLIGPNNLSEEGKKLLEKAHKKLAQERTFLAGWFKQPNNKDSLVKKLPKELVKVILDYTRAEP